MEKRGPVGSFGRRETRVRCISRTPPLTVFFQLAEAGHVACGASRPLFSSSAAFILRSSRRFSFIYPRGSCAARHPSAKSRRVTRSSCSSSSEARAALIIRPGKRGRMAVIRSRCRSRGRWVCAPAPVA